jgi:hypothetical protein
VEQNKYNAFRIPPLKPEHSSRLPQPTLPRLSQPESGEPDDQSSIGSEYLSLGDLTESNDFVEIEYEFTNQSAVDYSRSRQIAAASQPIGPRQVDPIRERFFEMRSLVSGNPFARNDAKVFYRQAQYMADFTDDYWDYAEFKMYYPYYQHMGYDQLRTYFTWRTAVRQGTIRTTPLSYVFLYIYELLGCIGVSDASEGLDKLFAVWDKLRGHEPTLDKYLPHWLKDYHIYYDMPKSFTDFVSDHEMQSYYPDLFLFADLQGDRLTLLNNLSNYDITKSKFLDTENRKLFTECLDYVFDNINSLAENHDIKIADLFSLGIKAYSTWYPFSRALFYDWQDQPDRTVELPGGEVYQCRNNRWTSNTVIHSASRFELVGYLLKKTEACLRQALKHKFKLTVNSSQLSTDLKRLGIPLTEFDKAIEQAVANYYVDKTRTVVIVDPTNLAKIRREALSTQDRLIVGEDVAFEETLVDESEEYEIEIHESHGDIAAIDSSQPAHRGIWGSFLSALDPIEQKALAIVLQDTDSGDISIIKAFADANGMMLEVLVDGINEKAFDLIGDNVFDLNDGITIYDEYRQQLEEVFV